MARSANIASSLDVDEVFGTHRVAGTFGLAAVISHVVPAGSPTASVIFMIGMAVGVDYSLFYLRREREERAAGRDDMSAVRRAAATSGQAVLVSGAIVMVAMAGMLFTGAKIFTSIGAGTMAVVFVAMVGSVTVLPAVLAGLGGRVEKGRLPLLGRSRGSGQGRLWGTILGPVLARPLVAAIGAALLLAGLALPALRMHTQLLDFTSLPKSTQIVQAYQRIQAAFPGSSLPASVVIQAPDLSSAQAMNKIAALKKEAMAAGEVSGPIEVRTNAAKTVTVVDVPLAGGGTDAISFRALDRLRHQIIPATVGKIPGATAAVTGETAGTKDFNDTIRSHLALVFGFVIGLAFLLLLVTFRSIVIPVKAVVLNLLSVGAAYGVLVAVFQYGWGAALIGATRTGAITSWLPLFLFVILFGLSMDYHVFILSRVKELADRGMPTREAVAQGIKNTAGTVTSAAVVMVAVFAIFVTGQTTDLKQMGFGLAVAVLLDATLIRGILLPATMELLGERNWYLPKWLGGSRAPEGQLRRGASRLHPQVHFRVTPPIPGSPPRLAEPATNYRGRAAACLPTGSAPDFEEARHGDDDRRDRAVPRIPHVVPGGRQASRHRRTTATAGRPRQARLAPRLPGRPRRGSRRRAHGGLLRPTRVREIRSPR